VKVLFDHNVPKQLGRHLVGHAVRTAKEMSWSRIANGLLLQTAEDAGFDLLITADQNLSYQQNLSGRMIALIVLRSNSWKVIRPQVELVIAAVNGATAAGFYVVDFDRALRRKRSIE
jgi:hypothetical protein